MPVSYTHLVGTPQISKVDTPTYNAGDGHIFGILAVYKIQRRFSIVITGIVGRSIYPVSYTHLDVYKRQVL